MSSPTGSEATGAGSASESSLASVLRSSEPIPLPLKVSPPTGLRRPLLPPPVPSTLDKQHLRPPASSISHASPELNSSFIFYGLYMV